MNKENVELGLGWFDRLLQVAEKYKIRTIFKAVLILLIICASVGFVLNPTWIFEQYDKWNDKQHQKDIELRINNNEKLHILCERLMFKVNAERVMLLELHNSGSNINGLPFVKCSAIYESLNDSVFPISSQYQQQQLSLIPFSTYLFKNKYFCGDTEKLLDIDRGLYFKMKSNNANHFACCVIEGVEKPIAFLFVTFKKIDDNHDCNFVKKTILEESLKMSLLLELNKNIK